MATGLNTKVALDTVAVARVQPAWRRSSTFSGLGNQPPQLFTSGESEKVRGSLRFIRARSAGASMANSAAISGPMAMPRK